MGFMCVTRSNTRDHGIYPIMYNTIIQIKCNFINDLQFTSSNCRIILSDGGSRRTTPSRLPDGFSAGELPMTPTEWSLTGCEPNVSASVSSLDLPARDLHAPPSSTSKEGICVPFGIQLILQYCIVARVGRVRRRAGVASVPLRPSSSLPCTSACGASRGGQPSWPACVQSSSGGFPSSAVRGRIKWMECLYPRRRGGPSSGRRPPSRPPADTRGGAAAHLLAARGRLAMLQWRRSF